MLYFFEKFCILNITKNLKNKERITAMLKQRLYNANLSSMPQQACLGQYAILQGQSIVLMIVENKNTRGVSDGWSVEILIK